MQMTREIAQQIDAAYRKMAQEMRYRPAAPSDGFGHVIVPERELDLEAECAEYASSWWRAEDDLDYHIGCPSFEERPALIYVIEAARNLCGGGNKVARKLLEQALRELDARPESALERWERENG